MRISIIAAMSRNRVIGRDNRLPWRLPADLARFKKLTMGRCLLMGRKTFESIGRPLPGRTTIVITRQKDYAPADVRVAHSLEEALGKAIGDEVFIAGGAEIYRQALPLADRLYLTVIQKSFEGDAYFPELDKSSWQLVWEADHKKDEDNPYDYGFLLYERKQLDAD